MVTEESARKISAQYLENRKTYDHFCASDANNMLTVGDVVCCILVSCSRLLPSKSLQKFNFLWGSCRLSNQDKIFRPWRQSIG